MPEIDLKAKANVLSAVKALVFKDKALLEETMNAWNSEASKLLVIWCTEAITKWWFTFDERDLFGIKTNDIPLAVLKATNSVSLARSYLRDKVALQAVLETH